MTLENKNKVIKLAINILLLFLPLMDVLRITPIKDIQILGISFVEFFNILLIFVAFVMTFFKIKFKEFKYLIIYTIIFIIYIILHSFNILRFNTNLLPNSDISIFKETFYLFRVYYLPILLFFILYKNRDVFNKEYLLKIIKDIIVIISLSIIILNIFKLSYATYDSNNVFLNYNIFDFYKSNVSYKLLSTRGLFHSGNEISAILLMLLPINIFYLWKNKKKSNYFLFFIQVISMIIIGTRISVFGALLVCLTSIFINIFMHFTRKSKIKWKFILFTIITCLYFFISPIGLYYLNYKTPDFSIDNQECYDALINLTDTELIISNIIDNSYEYRINNEFIQLYPVSLDVSFWKNVALRDKRINNDNRVMKTDILNRVFVRNDNKYDKLLGIGYTSNFMDLERDYVYQFYLFGIVGLIVLIGPYFFLLFLGIIKILKNIKKYYSQYTALLGMSVVLMLIIAYLTGHVFGQVSPTLYLSVILYLFLIDLMEDYDESKCNSSNL